MLETKVCFLISFPFLSFSSISIHFFSNFFFANPSECSPWCDASSYRHHSSVAVTRVCSRARCISLTRHRQRRVAHGSHHGRHPREICKRKHQFKSSFSYVWGGDGCYLLLCYTSLSFSWVFMNVLLFSLFSFAFICFVFCLFISFHFPLIHFFIDILNDETTRKYLQSIKRLMSIAQQFYPTVPCKSVDYVNPVSTI